MKKQLIRLGVAALIVGSAGSASATLVNQGNGVIWDNVADQYWYQDVGQWNNSEYMETLQTIDLTLNGAGDSYQSDSWGSWRMAGMTDMTNLWAYSYSDILGFFNGSTLEIDDPAGNVFYLKGRFDVGYQNYLGTPVHSTAYLSEFTPSSGPVQTTKSELVGGGWVADDVALAHIGAWVVADAIPTPTPEPATMLLFGTGLVGLIGSRLRKKKK